MSNSIPSHIKEQLESIHSDQLKRSELMPNERLQEVYRLFRDRFGPDKLAAMDGEELLNAMHAHDNRESLVYWLEFKNDNEFPSPAFGSISGGSSHKFGLFRRQDTKQWVAGSGPQESGKPGLITEQIAAGCPTALRADYWRGMAVTA